MNHSWGSQRLLTEGVMKVCTKCGLEQHTYTKLEGGRIFSKFRYRLPGQSMFIYKRPSCNK